MNKTIRFNILHFYNKLLIKKGLIGHIISYIKMKKILSYLWELPQNLIGLGLSFIYKYDELIPYENKQIRYCKKFPGGISLGNYVFVGTKKKDIIRI